MNKQREWKRTVKCAGTFDVCVIGGSCTGVFAAVRAARLGASVALVEKENRFGGVATLGLVGMWHSLFDFTGEQQIIGGLTFEILEQMERRGAVTDFRKPAPCGISFNTEELTLALDRLSVREEKIQIFLQSQYIGADTAENGECVERIYFADKSGIFFLEAKMFVDASGDALLCRDAGVKLRKSPNPQPPTACCRIEGLDTSKQFQFKELVEKYRNEIPSLPCGYAWGMRPPDGNSFMIAGTRVCNCDCTDAAEVTRGELESRAQIYAFTEAMRREFPDRRISISALPSALGIRDGAHITSLRRLEGDSMLRAEKPFDAAGQGTYPVDIHSRVNDQIEFFNLSGEHLVLASDKVLVSDRWLPDGEILPYYQFTISSMIPGNLRNLISAGRMIDADEKAFGAVRVMVNLNQCGEAAGTAAALAASNGSDIRKFNAPEIHASLAAGGSIVL